MFLVSLKKGFSLLAFCAFAATVHAQVTNGSFETGASENATAIAGWGTVGDTFLSTNARFSTPPDGSYQATTVTTTDGSYGEHSGVGVTATAAESYLGLSSGAFTGVGNGTASLVSAVRQTIHLNAGDQLLFSYDFLTDEVYKANDPSDTRPATNRNDFGFLSYSLGGTSKVTKLIDTFYGYSSTGAGADDFSTGLVPTPVTDPLVSESGYLGGSFLATVAGDYTFGFGVVNAEMGAAGTSADPSGLLVDNVRIRPGQPTPEPASLAAVAMGVVAAVRRRKRA